MMGFLSKMILDVDLFNFKKEPFLPPKPTTRSLTSIWNEAVRESVTDLESKIIAELKARGVYKAAATKEEIIAEIKRDVR